jgi:glycosyltransferase involved in cell wall biosynthesis
MMAGEDGSDRAGPPKTLLISSNSFFSIANFRGRLVEALVDAGYAVRIAAPEVDHEWVQSRGAEALEIEVDRSGLNPVNDARLWLGYLRLFRRTKLSYFLGFTAKPNIYGSLAAHLLGVASLPNVSGLGTAFMSDGLLSRIVGSLYRLAFLGCPIVFFQNADDRDLFVARRIVRSHQARLLPGSGIDLDHFAPAPPPPEDGQLRFLFIGRLLGDKGVREYVEAARLLRADHPNWRFQLLGDVDPGNRTGISAAEVGQWVHEGVIEHLGHADDVRSSVASATAVVLPSYREGMPRSLLEAAAMARPLIATDVPGCRQLVDHGVNGLLCRARDAQSLAEAIRELGSMDPQRRAQMGQAARALVEREYGVERVVRAYLDALAQLAGEAGVRID